MHKKSTGEKTYFSYNQENPLKKKQKTNKQTNKQTANKPTF